MTRMTGAWLAVGLSVAGCGDRFEAERTAEGDAQAKKAEEFLASGETAKALAAADLAAAYDPLNPARRDLVYRSRLTALIRNPDSTKVDDATSLELQSSTLLRRDPARAPTYLTASAYLVAARDAQQALALFDEAIAKNPAFAPALVGKAALLVAAGKKDEAGAALEKAVQAEATFGPALVALGRLQLEKGENDKATATLEKAVTARPNDATAHQYLAVAYWRGKKVPESGKVIQRAAELDPKSGAIRLELANWLKETGNAEAAFEQYGIASQLGADPTATFSRGLLLFQAKNYGDAAKSFDAAAVNRMPSALYESGRAYEAGGDANTAAQRYQRFVSVMEKEAGEKERLEDAQRRLAQLQGQGQAQPPPQ